MVQLPTVISTTVLLNAILRGAEQGVEKLGGSYTSVVVNTGFSDVQFQVFYSAEEELSTNPLDTAQQLTVSKEKVFSMNAKESSIKEHKRSDQSHPLFKEKRPKFFFLNDEDAMAYVLRIEERAANLVVESVQTRAKKV